ncbi:F-box and WD-40 domain protein 10 [Cricetulus griseus]
MENMEPRIKQAPFFRCESGLDWVPVCQKCETCVLAWKIFATKEWFRRVSDISQRRFLVSILGQLNSLYLLRYFQNILQTTQGKDFIYNRSRIKYSRKEGKEEKIVKSSLTQMLDETVEQKMKEILYWFGNSTHRTKANYTLLLLQMCDTKLLLTAANVIRVLFLKEWNNIAGISKLEDDPCNLLLSLDDIQALSSGSSKYRDFIRYLPLHLSKYILRMLDKNSLTRCAFVSQHWAALTQQVKMDLSMQSFLQNQISLLQNDYNLWTAYQNQETQLVQMEERNVFCGTYNIRILSDTKDQNRIIHYNGGDLMALSSNRKIHLLNIMQAREMPIEFRGHAGSIRALYVSEEENILFSGSYDLSIRYWDMTTGSCIRIFYGHQGTITCLDLYKNRLASGARDGQVKEWDIETGKCLKTFKHKDAVLAVKISETYIVSSCERGIVRVWHAVTAQLLKTLMGHEGAVKCLFFNQWHLVSGGADGLVMAWSMVGKYERCLMAFKHPKEVLQVSLLYLRVISACGDGKIRIYNFLNGNCLKVIKVDARGDPVLSFFYQGNRMVVQTDSNILLFQFENVKWQYSSDRGKTKKMKDKEEEKEEISLADVHSKSSTQMVPIFHGLLICLCFLFEESDDVESHGEEISQPMKKFWKVPMTPDRFLLTVNALQKAHNSEEFAYPGRPKTPVIDAWGPSIPYPRKVLNFKGKSIQYAVDQLRSSNILTDMKQTNIPLEIQKLQPNLKKSLHSPRVQSTIPQPRLIRSRASDILKGDDFFTSSIDGEIRPRVAPLTSMQVIKPNRMLAPRGGTATLSLKKERPRFYTTLDPLRMNTGFMLLTVKEEKEYGEAKMKEYQTSESTKVVDPGAAPAPPTLAPVTLASPTSASLTTEPLQFWLRPYAPPPTVRILHFWTRFPRPSHYAALPYGRYGPAYRSSGPGSCSLPRASLKRKCCRQVASGWSWTLASWTVLTNPRQFLTRPGSGLR